MTYKRFFFREAKKPFDVMATMGDICTRDNIKKSMDCISASNIVSRASKNQIKKQSGVFQIDKLLPLPESHIFNVFDYSFSNKESIKTAIEKIIGHNPHIKNVEYLCKHTWNIYNNLIIDTTISQFMKNISPALKKYIQKINNINVLIADNSDPLIKQHYIETIPFFEGKVYALLKNGE